MTLKTSLVMVAAITLVTASTASAQRHGGGGRSAGSSHSAARSAAPRSAPAAGPRASVASRGVVASRGPRAIVGAGQTRRYGTVVRPYGFVGSGVFRGPITFYRPYYSFRPRISLGFGLWAGFPIAYPYDWGYYDPFYAPYYSAAPYPYPVAPGAYPDPALNDPAGPPAYPPSSYPQQSGSVGVEPTNPSPSQQDMGGVSFQISPAGAEIFVDGQRAGTVDQFTPTSQPLGLAAGPHRIEIRAAGYKSMDFDVDIVAGQVIPYQGTLERQ